MSRGKGKAGKRARPPRFPTEQARQTPRVVGTGARARATVVGQLAHAVCVGVAKVQDFEIKNVRLKS